mgnify:CR=1 FL=1
MESQPGRKIVVSLVVLLMIVPLNVVHEAGHGFICALYGNDYSITLSLFGRSNVVCHGNDMNRTMYGAAGGLSVMAVSLALLLMPAIRNNTGIRIGLVSIVSVSFVNAIMEGFFFDFYNGNLLVSEMGLLAVLLLGFVGQWILIIQNK